VACTRVTEHSDAERVRLVLGRQIFAFVARCYYVSSYMCHQYSVAEIAFRLYGPCSCRSTCCGFIVFPARWSVLTTQNRSLLVKIDRKSFLREYLLRFFWFVFEISVIQMHCCNADILRSRLVALRSFVKYYALNLRT